MLDTEFWTQLTDILKKGTPACLIIMVQSTGHGPNRAGARMMVTADGRHHGTVGGGASEVRLAETARHLISLNQASGPNS
ncbi:MAG: XdhC family protein [candidate division KSB1 bacterium]|nr:XdhC family protein [candidate division KSB1 bacterium]